MIPRQDEDEEPAVESRTGRGRRPGLLRRLAGRALRAAARASDRRRTGRRRRNR